jgi:hypothetical protein
LTGAQIAETVELRDSGPYSARNSSKGALIDETSRIVGALGAGLTVDDVRQQVLDGQILTQRSWSNRRRIWTSVQQRYLPSHPEWISQCLQRSHARGPHSSEFLTSLYLLYCLKDRLAFDFVTTTLWSMRCQSQSPVSRRDVLDLLEQSSSSQPQIRRWSESTRIKLAGSILTALRDFGVLSGKQKKTLVRPILPPLTAEFILRVLVAEGGAGRQITEELTWRLFFLTPSDVSALLGRLAQSGTIRFEKAGTTVVLEVPPDWEQPG